MGSRRSTQVSCAFGGVGAVVAFGLLEQSPLERAPSRFPGEANLGALDRFLRGLDQRPADARRALLGGVAEPGLVGGGAHGRGQPRPGAEVARRAEAADLADLSRSAAAPCRGRPREAALAPGRVGRVPPARRSHAWPCAISWSRSSIGASRLSRRRRGGSRNGRAARKRRPPAPKRSASLCWIPRRASGACTRFCSAVRIRVNTIRSRSRSRRSRSSRGATYASGSRSVRNRCASVRASTASVVTRAAAIAFVRNRCERRNSRPSLSSGSASHSQP
jgi:hypothetical protein